MTHYSMSGCSTTSYILLHDNNNNFFLSCRGFAEHTQGYLTITRYLNNLLDNSFFFFLSFLYISSNVNVNYFEVYK